jgi:hypothetical protein
MGKFLATLGDAGVVETELAKMLASCSSAYCCRSPKAANGAAGAGFCRAWMRLLAAFVAASAEEVRGMLLVAGKNSTISEMPSAAVEVTNTR